MTDDATTIAAKTERVAQSIERLEDGEVSLEQAAELHREARALLDELEAELAVGDGEVVERDES